MTSPDPPPAAETTPPAPAAETAEWQQPVLWALVAWALLAGLPYAPALHPLAALMLGTILFLAASLALIASWARLPLRPAADTAGLAAFLALSYLCRLAVVHWPDLRPVGGAAAGVSFLLACICAGRLLALLVRERNLLLPVALVAGLADVFTVFAGPTGKALVSAPQLVEKLSVAIPQLGSAMGPHGARGMAHVATAGLGDFIFMTFFLVGAYRYGLRARASIWAMFVAVALGMGAVLLIPGLPALPLLPFVVLGFLVANASAFRLSRSERVQTVVVVIVVGALVAGALYLAQQR